MAPRSCPPEVAFPPHPPLAIVQGSHSGVMMSTVARLCRSAVLLVSAVLPLAAPAQQTRRVPQDLPTIQAAINASATGDTVLVAPGTWFEDLTLDTKEITLTSVAGAATTILDGSHAGPVLQITNTPGTATLISGFTIQNGTAPRSPSNVVVITGGGIYAINAGLTIANSNFRSIIGPSLVASNSTLSLNNSTITTTDGSACTNAGVGQHSGVYLTGDSVLTANGAPIASTIFGNTISGDGSFCAGEAITLESLTSQTLIKNNILRNNLGGIDAESAPFSLVQNLIFDNGLGAVGIGSVRPAGPSTGPATTFLLNNTLVNNHTSQDTLNGPFVTEIAILNSAAHVAMRNNIIIGTTQYAVLSCQSDSQDSTAHDTPLLLDHNDLFNTSGGGVLSGTCFPTLASPLTVNGNISLDPRFSSSTDLRPLAGSPVLDAGINLVDAPLTDFAGNPRIVDSTGKGYPVIDLGAYERAGAASSTTPTALSLQPAAFTLAPGNLSLSVTAKQLTALGVAPLPTGSVTILLNGIATSASVALDPTGNANPSLPLTLPGVYALSATLSPSLGFAPATSPVVYVRVTDAPAPTTTLTLASSPATQTLNQPITLTIHLGSTTSSGAATTAGPVPPGAVTLLEGSTILSSLQPDATGLATYTIPKPGLGSHTYTVTYAGTTLYPAATATTSVSVTAPVATSLTATAAPNPAPLNTSVYCSVKVVAASGPAPTGIVSFTDGATPIGSIALTTHEELGLVSILVGSQLSFGLHTITVTFTGDPGFSASTGTCTVNVGGDATRTTLVSSKNPASATDTVTYIATVANTGTSAAITGSVSLSEGSTLLASAPLVPGTLGTSTASLPANLTLPGVHILTATYLPATSATFPSSATLTETVTAPPTITTALAAYPNPVTFGQPTTLSATLTSSAVIPGPATVTFTDGATILGTVPLLANGATTLPVGPLSIGTHQLSATLRTSASVVPLSTSNSVTVQVNGLPDILTLSVSPSPTALATAPVTLAAILAPASSLPPASTPASTLAGTITFFDGTLPLGTATISAAGQGTLTTSALSPGSHTLTASFSGNTVFTPATSATVAEQILSNPTTTTLSIAPAATAAFAPVTLAAHVASTTSATRINTLTCTPACVPITVTFIANSTTGGSILGIVPVDASGNAILALSPSAGVSSVTASFSGSPLFAPSSSAAAPLTVSAAPTALTLTANPNPVYQHGNVTLTAALTAPGAPASAPLTDGTVTFLEGANPLGTTSLFAAQAFAYTPTTVGAHTLTAIFSGTANLSGASATVTVTVLPSDFVLSLKDPTLTIATTHHAPTTLTINTTGTLADQIDLSCANLPHFATCTFAPATQDLTQTSSSAGTLTLDTDALLNFARADPPASPFHHLLHQTSTLVALCLPVSLLAARRRRRRSPRGTPQPRLPHLLALLLLSLSALTLSGCSGLYPGHVAPGTYTVTVTGHARTSGLEHSTQLNLVVTP